MKSELRTLSMSYVTQLFAAVQAGRLTVDEIAKELGYRRATVQRYFRNITEPDTYWGQPQPECFPALERLRNRAEVRR